MDKWVQETLRKQETSCDQELGKNLEIVPIE